MGMTKWIRNLERDVIRKKKALAEATTILVLARYLKREGVHFAHRKRAGGSRSRSRRTAVKDGRLRSPTTRKS